MTQLGAPLHAGSKEYRPGRGRWHPGTPPGYFVRSGRRLIDDLKQGLSEPTVGGGSEKTQHPREA